MSYSVGSTAYERLPVIEEMCLIVNNGTADIILGNTPSELKPYGTHIQPNNNLLYDLSKQRYIIAVSGSQLYDILPGGQSSVPGSAAIVSGIISSSLATDIATKVVASSLSQDVATNVLNTGTRVIDQPTTTTWGPLDDGGNTSIFDMSNAQSYFLPWAWTNTSAANLSAFGQLTLAWYDTVAGGQQTFADQFEIASTNINVTGTIMTSIRGYIIGSCKGNGLKIFFDGTPVGSGGAGRISASGALVKSFRLSPIDKWLTDDGIDRVLGTASANGIVTGTQSNYFAFSPYDGIIELNAWMSNTATANTGFIQYGWGSTQFPIAASP